MEGVSADPDLIALTAEIVSAYVSNNAIKSGEVALLVKETHGALAGLGERSDGKTASEPAFIPAVTVRKSLASRDHILSMIDGRPYKVLSRHLKAHGLTPVQYRERYNLPKTYPIVAPAYSEARRAMALKIGLGNKRRAARSRKAQAPAGRQSVPKKRGRPPKAS